MASLNNQQKFLVVVGTEGQEAETALQQVYSGYWIDNATGDQLDVLGRVVGQLRNGMTDDDFRRLIRARISVNRSKGTIASVLTVAKLVVDDDTVEFIINNAGYAGFELYLLGNSVTVEVADLAISMLAKTKSAGVRFILTWSPDPVADWLIWDEGNWDDDNWFGSMDA